VAKFKYQKIYSKVIASVVNIFILVIFFIVLLSLYLPNVINHKNGIYDRRIVSFSFSVIFQSQFISKISFDLEILNFLEILNSRPFFALYIQIIITHSRSIHRVVAIMKFSDNQIIIIDSNTQLITKTIIVIRNHRCINDAVLT
jgi:hypothetical protein